jgi:SAM-dependent methyltransferase
MSTLERTTGAPDPQLLDAHIQRFVADAGATMHAATILLGDRLGLYRALAQGPADAAELARRAGVNERSVLEWLRAQAAAGYVTSDETGLRFWMTPEQAFMLAAPDGLNVAGAYLIAASVFSDLDRLEDAFRTGKGMGWHEHHHDLFHGTERFFRPNYAMNLVSGWIPALDGVEARLRAGGSVADVGCGHGSSTLLMAQAFPQSEFTGFDYHVGSIETARQRAAELGLGKRVRFEVASAKAYPGSGYDLVTFFDCLHDMGDPAGAAAHVRKSLAPAGSWMVVEPAAEDEPVKNFNPVGRLFYAASSMICTLCSQAQEVGAALGAQAGESRLRDVIMKGGFRSVRRAAQTPFNLVLEAKP